MESAILHSSLITLQSSIVFALLTFQFLLAAPPDSLPRDTVVPGPRTVKAGTAVLLSGLIPGGGQFYVRQPLKGAVIAASELTLAGFSVYYHTQENEDTRNTFLWWTGFVWAVSMADAYVSAHLYSFKDEQRLNLQLTPTQLGLSYRF